MQLQKVSCSKCQHYHSCSQKTKMFVNYCGSDRKKVEDQIKEAILECRRQRGHLFTKGFLLEIQSGLLPKQLEPSYSS